MTNLEKYVDEIAAILYDVGYLKGKGYINYFDILKTINEKYIHNGTINNYGPHKIIEDIKTFLLSDYKQKYILTKFEHDLFTSLPIYISIMDREELVIMKNKGYFKDIPTDISIEKIIENCEVIDSDKREVKDDNK